MQAGGSSGFVARSRRSCVRLLHGLLLRLPGLVRGHAGTLHWAPPGHRLGTSSWHGQLQLLQRGAAPWYQVVPAYCR